MAKPTATLEQLQAGLSLPTGALHRIVVPPPVVRVRLTRMLFDTDKAFLLPSSIPGVRRLKQIYDEYPGATVLVSGHADRAGSDAYNVALSVERAGAIAAFLQDTVDDWLPWYDAAKPASKRWGALEDQHMLATITDGAGAPYYAGPVLGKANAAARTAMERFQEDQGLPQGPVDAETRRALVTQYMALDGTTLPAGTSISTHGCGEFHPSVATKNSVALRENRRVEVFLFRGAIRPPAVDPCPAGGCSEYPEWVARSIRTVDLNADPEVVVLLVDEIGLPLGNNTVRLSFPDGRVVEVRSDAQGVIRPRVPPGTSFDLEIADVHEVGAADSLVTPSGQHFGAGLGGPEVSP